MSASLGSDDVSVVVSSPTGKSNLPSSGASSPPLGVSPEMKVRVPDDSVDYEIDFEAPIEVSVQVGSKCAIGLCTSRTQPYPDVSVSFFLSKIMTLQLPASCSMQ